VYSDLAGLAALKRNTGAPDAKALREVAQQFESVFAKMLLTSMRQATASFGDPLFGSDQQQFYQGMYDDQLSIELTKGKGLGLAEMLVRQLQRVAGVTDDGSGAGGVDAKGSGALKPLAGGSGPAPAHQLALTAAARSASLALTSGSPAQNAALTQNAGLTQNRGLADNAALTPESGLSSEPASLSANAALTVATQFIQKMVSGNSVANALPASFRTPQSPEDFVRQLWPCAEEAGRELGINPTHLLAQAALETGWGKAMPCDANGNPSFNFFGIKAGSDWPGAVVSARTLEFQGGLPVPQNARFRSYDSAQDSFRDYVALLRDNPRYAAALNTGNDAQAFATALQGGGYATDPAYAQKITSIAQNLENSATALKSSAAQPIPSTPAPL
jgi:flagellar protein FlgJ